MQKQIAVSVILMNYNQEKYLRSALDSILMQKVDFDYEIVIGDDCSSDGSSELLKKYYRKYPDRIRLILRKNNYGPCKNLYDLLYRTRGNYIAYLEADDYWTDENKLQKQYDFLESHREYIGCSHSFKKIDFYGNVESESFINGLGYGKEPYIFKNNCCTFKDLEQTRWVPSHMNTLLFRNIFLDRETDYSFLYKSHDMVGDITIFLMLLAKGNIYRLPDNMSIYRHVVKDGEQNYDSVTKNDNVELKVFMYHKKLEYFAFKNLHCVLDFSLRKKNTFGAAINRFMGDKSLKNLKIMLRILCESDRKLEYFCFMIKGIALKQYYKMTGKSGRLYVKLWKRGSRQNKFSY